MLRHSADGRRFRNALWTVPGRDREIAAFADYWRRVGIEVEELTIPAAQVRNSEFRALYPSWESTAQGSGDSLFARLEGPAASAANRLVGERGGYEDVDYSRKPDPPLTAEQAAWADALLKEKGLRPQAEAGS